MNDETQMKSDELTGGQSLDQAALRAVLALSIVLGLLVAVIAYSSFADLAWLQWLLAHGWVIAVAIIIVAMSALFVFDMTRAKNIAWRSLGEKFGVAFKEQPDRDNVCAGRGQVGDHWYLGIRCFASPEGIEINRIVRFINPPLSIPWSAIAKIDTFPNLLTGRKGFETDMQAQIILRDQSSLTIEVPWLMDFRKFLPKSVKYRAIKLSKK